MDEEMRFLDIVAVETKMIRMEIKRPSDKGFCMYFETVEDVRKFKAFVEDLIEGVKKK